MLAILLLGLLNAQAANPLRANLKTPGVAPVVGIRLTLPPLSTLPPGFLPPDVPPAPALVPAPKGPLPSFPPAAAMADIPAPQELKVDDLWQVREQLDRLFGSSSVRRVLEPALSR